MYEKQTETPFPFHPNKFDGFRNACRLEVSFLTNHCLFMYSYINLQEHSFKCCFEGYVCF